MSDQILVGHSLAQQNSELLPVWVGVCTLPRKTVNDMSERYIIFLANLTKY